MPAPFALNPGRRSVYIARAGALPSAADPDMRVAPPLPMSGRPNVACARRRNGLIARRGWGEIQLDIDLGRAGCCYGAERSGSNQCGHQGFLREHGDVLHKVQLRPTPPPLLIWTLRGVARSGT